MKLKIQPKMIAGFFSMSVLLVILGAVAIFFTDRMLSKTQNILKDNVSSLKAAEELEIALMDMKGLAANYLLDGERRWLEIFNEKEQIFRRWFKVARTQAHTENENTILSSADVLFQKYLRHHQSLVLLHQQGDFQAARIKLAGPLRDTFTEIYEKCENYLFINEKIMYQTSRQMERENRIVNVVIACFAVGSVVLGLSFGMVIARSITKPLYRLIVKVKGVAEDHVLEELDISGDTEFEKLDKHVKILIDKIHQTNKDLRHSRQMLIHSEKLALLGSIAAGLAHEIRNPLTSIKMLIYSLLDKESNNTKEAKDFNVILQQVIRMEAFLQNFLDFARPPEPVFKQIKVQETLEQALHLMSPQLQQSHIRLRTKWNASDPSIHADSDQMKQVIMNLTLNSIQAMTQGGLLSIETRITNDPDRRMQIQISDTGPGVPEELLPVIFNPFTTTKKNGTGLGLAITHQIIKNHGGSVRVENIKPHGARFIIQLPIEWSTAK